MLILGVVIVAFVVGRAVAGRVAGWSPPSPVAGKPYVDVVNRFLASQYHAGDGVFASGSRWYCATKFLGASNHGAQVTVYGWAECDETKRTGDRIRMGSGDSLPVVVHLRRVAGQLRGVGLDEPGDAPMYEPDVRRMFPADIAGWILAHPSPSDLRPLEANIVHQARHSASSTT
ncbi:MAG TPA: hypothetical protein VFJ24_07265 [Gaiellales bacterium]|nr:hypothetical protein [Gaiellales bacterium]